jgi:hypothetical protein
MQGFYSVSYYYRKVEKIMGDNFFGIEEAIKYFGVKPTSEQLSILSKIPFPEEILRECKDTHILVAVFPLSIHEIYGKVRRQLFQFGYLHDWLHFYYLKEHGNVSWQLIRKTPVDDSFFKNWQKQQSLINKNEEIPTTRVMVYAIIGHFLATHEYLFEYVSVRTSSLASDSNHIKLGFYAPKHRSSYRNALHVSDYGDNGFENNLGLCVSLKS